MTGLVNYKTAESKANASVFYFFNAIFFNTILASCINKTFCFAIATQAKPL